MNQRNPHPERAGTTLVVAWHKGTKGYEFGRVRTAQAFTNQLRAFTQAAEVQIDESESKPYAIGDDIDEGEYMISPIQAQAPEGEAPAQHARARAARAEDPLAFRNIMVAFGGMEQVGAAFLQEKETAFYAIIRGTNLENRIAYVRHLNPMKLAKPGNFLLTFGDVLQKLEQAVFLMDDRIDLIIRPNQIDILDKAFFDGLFFDVSGKGPEIDGIVRQALATLPIAAGTLNSLVERSRLKRRQRRKILEIQQSGHLAEVTINAFKDALTKEHYDLARFVVADAGGDEQIYAAPEDIDILLEILNEDLFSGDLTGRPLAASKKRPR